MVTNSPLIGLNSCSTEIIHVRFWKPGQLLKASERVVLKENLQLPLYQTNKIVKKKKIANKRVVYLNTSQRLGHFPPLALP